jgi:hypothetical protein
VVDIFRSPRAYLQGARFDIGTNANENPRPEKETQLPQQQGGGRGSQRLNGDGRRPLNSPTEIVKYR